MAKNGRFGHKKWLHFAPARRSAERALEVLIRGHLGPPKQNPASVYFFFFETLRIEKYPRVSPDRLEGIFFHY